MAITKERLSISVDKPLAGSLRQIAAESNTDISFVISTLCAEAMVARNRPDPRSVRTLFTVSHRPV